MIEYIRSLKWVDYFFFCLIDPRRLVNLIARKEGSPFLLGLLTVFIVSLIEVISYSMLGTETAFFYYKISYGWIFVFLLVVIQIIIFSSLFDLVSQLRGHTGSVGRVISLVNFSFLPLMLMLPLITIFVVLNFAPVFFYILFVLLLHAWQAMIVILGISEIYKTGFGEALLVFISPFVFTGLVFFFIMILFFVNLFGLFTAV